MSFVYSLRGFAKLWIALSSRILFDLLCLLLSPFIYLYYRNNTRKTISKSSITNGSLKKFHSIFITGASSGMGKTTSYYFAKQCEISDEEIILHLTGRNIQRLETVKNDCLQFTSNNKLTIYTYQVDITNPEAISNAILKADDIKKLDLVFANAGINFATCDSQEFMESTRQVINTNIIGTINTIFPILNRFMIRNEGHIAINASLASYTNRTDCSTYSATKVFLRFMCEVMHWGLNNYYNVNISVINPGYVRTAMYDVASNSNVKEDFRPNSVSEDMAAHYIVNGLENNEYSIDFPFSTFCLAWIVGSAHPIIRSVLGSFLVKQKIINVVFPSPK